MNDGPPVAGMLAANVMHFCRLLRRAGLPVAPADAATALAALQAIDLSQRGQVRSALRTTIIHRHDHEDLFEQAFRLFWRHPEDAAALAALSLLDGGSPPPKRPAPGGRRLAEAMQAAREPREPPPQEQRIDAMLTASESERLQQMDFEAMSAAEVAAAQAEIARLVLPLDQRRTRRHRPDPTGPKIDIKLTVRNALRQGGAMTQLARSRRSTRPPPLVVLCDISGSMARYSQLLLHFLHAVVRDRTRVEVFLFGTRLTQVTRALRHRDVEAAFETLATSVPDWSGGTRIGEILGRFNRDWARRVLGQGAVVLLVSDGLDRDGGAGLAAEMERLHKSCVRLVWLNPLLRWDGFAPKSAGIRAMLPHVDEFRPVHNLASLRALVRSLSQPVPAGQMARWRNAA